jgi:hypothetical protein
MKYTPILYMLFFTLNAHRNVHRFNPATLPRIVVWSDKNPKKHVLIDTNLRPQPLLRTFDKTHFETHFLPKGTIKYRYENTCVDTQELEQLIYHLLSEIDQKAMRYKDFIALKKSGFVRHKKCGLIVLRFKKHPFILKLFIEPPESFINPYDKGFEVSNIFVVGGSLRHTLGFSRIKTLNYTNNAIKHTPWEQRLTTPKKWFWLPKDADWLNIETYNLGNKKRDFARMPVTYGVIAEAIEKDISTNVSHEDIMQLSTHLEYRVDPHVRNFFVEKNTGKIALIDTELFPAILGFNKKIKEQKTHAQWYAHLAGKYCKEKFLSNKTERIQRQHNMSNYYAM